MIIRGICLFIKVSSLILLISISKFTLNIAFVKNSYNFINLNNKNIKSINKHVSSPGFSDSNTHYTLFSKQVEKSNPLDQNDLKYNKDLILERIRHLFLQLGYINDSIEFTSIPRVDYNRDSIVQTYELCRETDIRVCKNDYSELNDKYFVRFHGDDECELVPVLKNSIDEGTSLIKVPLKACYSLDSCMELLFDNINVMGNDSISKNHDNILHIGRLQDLSVGVFTKKLRICDELHRQSEIGKQIGSDSFQERLDEFIGHKRLLVLRSLILAEHILSVDHSLMRVLDNPYMKYTTINTNEKEIFLLTFALASEYYLKVLSSVIKYFNDAREYNEPKVEKARTMWLHHLFNREVSHIPLLFDPESVEQIQEPILRYKISQRKMVLADMMKMFTDPVDVVRDRLEAIAQHRSMLQDRSDGLYYSSKVDLKTNAEDVLEKIESEIYNSGIFHKVFSNRIFSISASELLYILGKSSGLDETVKNENNGNNETGTVESEDGLSGCYDCDEYDEKRLCIDFFNDFILNGLSCQDILNKPMELVISSLNGIVNINSMTRFFCTILSHVIRPEGCGTDAMETSYMVNSSPGIQCNLERSSSNHINSVDVNRAYIVPLIDLCNHSESNANSKITMDLLDHSPSFVVSSERGINAGGEILINYGNFDNNVCLLDYGFVSTDDGNNHVLMEVDSNMIKDSAKMHGTHRYLPTVFPEGIPKEKMDLIKSLNLVEINDKGDLSEVYKNPWFEGVPVVKYMEFNERFMSNRPSLDQSNLYYTSNSTQDRTLFVDKPVSVDDYEYSASHVNPLIRVDAEGTPESRLILFLKILLCKTRKKLDWIKTQDSEKLSRSINSPIDVKAFQMASSITLMQMSDKYSHSLFDDYKNALSGSRNRISGVSSEDRVKFVNLKRTGCKLINSLVLAHSMRRKIPIYKCSAFYSSISKQPLPTSCCSASDVRGNSMMGLSGSYESATSQL